MAFAYGNSAPLWQNGPTPGAFYNFPGKSSAASNEYAKDFSHKGEFGSQRSSTPITTGTSVVGIKYDTGVIISADTLVSYGSLARYRDVPRVFKINDTTILGAGGDYADLQYIMRHIDQKIIEDTELADNNQMKPKSLFNWLTRVLYNKRSRFEPLWLDLVIGGMQDGVPFLGHVNLRGRAYESNVVATGYGQHLALPLLREYSEKPDVPINEVRALDLTKKSMEVLFYRDCRGYPKYTQARVTATGVELEGPLSVEQNWNLATMISGY